MLSEECVFPKGSDTTYLQKVCNAHRKNAAFQEIKTSKTSFGVRHFAGEVVYNVSGFLEKNKDPVSQDLQAMQGEGGSVVGRREEGREREEGWEGGRWKHQSRMKEGRGGGGRGKESTRKVAGGSRRGEGAQRRRECGELKGARKEGEEGGGAGEGAEGDDGGRVSREDSEDRKDVE